MYKIFVGNWSDGRERLQCRSAGLMSMKWEREGRRIRKVSDSSTSRKKVWSGPWGVLKPRSSMRVVQDLIWLAYVSTTACVVIGWEQTIDVGLGNKRSVGSRGAAAGARSSLYCSQQEIWVAHFHGCHNTYIQMLCSLKTN